MKLAYVDTSVLVAIAFDEDGGAELAESLRDFDELVASNLLEAELRAAFIREKVAFEPALIGSLSWIMPTRPLTAEMSSVLEAGYLRGADLWHVACALFLSPDPSAVTFATLDARQLEIVRAMGFATL